MPSGSRSKLARSIFQSPVAFFCHCFEEDLLHKIFDKPAFEQGMSEEYDPQMQKFSNTYEKKADEALKTFFEVDMQLVFDSQMTSTTSTQGDGASYSSNFSFDPGSVKTTSALSKRPRFAHNKVPGSSKGVSGEGS